MALNRIEVRTEAATSRSVRLLDRLGFVREGTLREQVRGDDGTFLDVAVYGLLRSERSRLVEMHQR
jgi:RimJ/RimL family protein N-acetyltransferase